MDTRGVTQRTLSHQPNRTPETPTPPSPWGECGGFCIPENKILDILKTFL
jgi:hypothetical protein